MCYLRVGRKRSERFASVRDRRCENKWIERNGIEFFRVRPNGDKFVRLKESKVGEKRRRRLPGFYTLDRRRMKHRAFRVQRSRPKKEIKKEKRVVIE